MGGNTNRLITPVASADLDPRLRGLVDYWAEKSAGRCCPARSDLDPLDLKPLLGHLLMVDVLRQEDGAAYRLRYRLFGTEFIFYHGRDLTGRWLDEIENAVFRDELLGFYSTVIADRRMQTLSYDYVLDHGLTEKGRQRFQAVLLPLSKNASEVDIVLGCGVPVES